MGSVGLVTRWRKAQYCAYEPTSGVARAVGTSSSSRDHCFFCMASRASMSACSATCGATCGAEGAGLTLPDTALEAAAAAEGDNCAAGVMAVCKGACAAAGGWTAADATGASAPAQPVRPPNKASHMPSAGNLPMPEMFRDF